MIDRNSGLGWTDAQWNQARQAVADEWQRVRVAGSLLPSYGPLPPSTAVVGSELLDDQGVIDVAATARILEIYARLELSRQQVTEDDLSDATLLFRRAAAALAREEDRVVFNGQQPGATYSSKIPARAAPAGTRFPQVERSGGEPDLEVQLTDALTEHAEALLSGGLRNAVGISPTSPLAALLRTNPGAVGLVFAAAQAQRTATPLDAEKLVTAVVNAIASLDGAGYGPPYACIFSRTPFVEAHRPLPGTLVLPSDRIEPLLGQQIVRAPALDEGPAPTNHVGRGLVLSFAGGALDLAVASEATPEFIHISDTGKYRFRVVERFALRVKDPDAIVRLEFAP
jgi:uncharacterized linocin/CFP29 family protein